MIVREIIPGVAVRAVVFTDRAPLAFAQVGPHLRQGTPFMRASSSRACSRIRMFDVA